MKYHVRIANLRDLPSCYDLRREAERWLAAEGIEQWTNPETGRQNLQTFAARRSLRVVTDTDGTVVGCFALDTADQDFWTAEEAAQPALYLYKLIITRRHRGRGLGDAILNYACEHASENGFAWLRLDCWKTNLRLQQYYLDRGFEHVDTRDAPGRNSGWLAERPTSLLTTCENDEHDDVVLVEEPTSDDRYDPDGTAAIWQQASSLVESLKNTGHSGEWDAALDQAARLLERRAIETRQAHGTYHRVLTG